MIAAIQNLRKLIKVNTLKTAVSMANQALYKTTSGIFSRLFCYRESLVANLSEYSIFKELLQLFKLKLLFYKTFFQNYLWATSPITRSI
jgi:hypothetical protein